MKKLLLILFLITGLNANLLKEHSETNIKIALENLKIVDKFLLGKKYTGKKMNFRQKKAILISFDVSDKDIELYDFSVDTFSSYFAELYLNKQKEFISKKSQKEKEKLETNKTVIFLKNFLKNNNKMSLKEVVNQLHYNDKMEYQYNIFNYLGDTQDEVSILIHLKKSESGLNILEKLKRVVQNYNK